MSPWLRFLFGLGEGEVPDGARARFELTGMPHGGAWWLAACVVLAACVLIALLYRSERELGRLQSVALAALRLAALLVVVWMLLDPRILTVIEHKREASTLVLFDASASMGHADPIDPRDRKELEAATGRDLRQEWSRAELALGAIRQSSLLERLGEKNRVRSFTFDAVLVPVSELGASAFVPPGGPETRLGDALRGALAQAGSEPVAAVVLFTDGRTTGGERLEKAAAEAALRGVPVHAVALGTGRQPRNLAVAELSGPEVVQPGVPLRLQGRIEASGVREPVTVKLSRQPLRSGAKEDIETRKVEGRSLKWSSNVVFTDVLPRSGTYRYFLSVDLAPARRRDETDPADNQREVRVTASEERCRALLAASSPGRDFKFLGDFLTRDDGIQASCWLASADPRREQDGDVVIHELPQTPEALRSYDAVVLFDPDQKVLTPAFLEALKGFVLEQGGGLAYVAGEYNARAVFESPALAALRALLPVEGIGPAGASGGGAAHGAASAQAASVHAYTRPWRPVLTPQGADHPVLRLKDEAEESARAWSALPPLYFNVPARGLKPAASALLEKDGDVVAAAGRAGAGYVVFLGTDETWRWRAAGREVPERFWAALVRYIAAGKRIAGTGEATLHADRDRYTAGEDVALEASLTDPERKPVVQERVEVAVETGEDGAVPVRLNLLPLAGRPGWYGARYRPEAPGHFTAQVAAGGQFSSAKASFVVAVPSTELSDPSPDLEALEDAARRTGGRIYTLAETGRVPENIGDRSVREVIGRSAATVWDSPALMLLFGALLTVEWILRKLWRLN